jgi:hypothetical protein
MFDKLKALFAKKTAAAPVHLVATPTKHPHSFSCPCEDCTRETAELTEKRLKGIRK